MGALVLDLFPNFDIFALFDGKVVGGQERYGGRHALLHDAVGPRDGTRPGIAVLAEDLEDVLVGNEGHAGVGRVESEMRISADLSKTSKDRLRECVILVSYNAGQRNLSFDFFDIQSVFSNLSQSFVMLFNVSCEGLPVQ